MDRNEFYEQMRKKIEENLPESILAEGELVIKEARKNNDVMMHGIMIFCIVFLLKSLTFARLCSPRYISCSFPRFHAACGYSVHVCCLKRQAPSDSFYIYLVIYLSLSVSQRVSEGWGVM